MLALRFSAAIATESNSASSLRSTRSPSIFVEQTSFNHYPELDDAEQTKRMNIAKVCEIMSWENKGLGFLSDEGFAVPVDKSLFLGECLHVTEDDLCDGEIEYVEVCLPSE